MRALTGALTLETALFAATEARGGDVYAAGDRIIHPDADTWRYTAIAVGATAAFAAIRTDGMPLAWGRWELPLSPASAGLQAVAKPKAIGISVGFGHGALLRSDGTVECWGTNDSGQCAVPTDLPRCRQAVVARFGTFALTEAGEIRSWGTVPAPPAQIGPCDFVVSSWGRAAAITTNGEIVVWGYPGACEGNACVSPSEAEPAIDVALGFFRAVALRADGAVIGWGDDPHSTTAAPEGLLSATDVAAGDFFSCALQTDGRVVFWGSEIPQGAAAAGNEGGIVAVSASGGLVGFLMSDGTAVTFSGEGGNTMPKSLGPCKEVAMSSGHVVALLEDGSVSCFGSNDFGQCDAPAGLGDVIDVAAGTTSTTVVNKSGDVICWGAGGVCPPPGSLGPCVQVDAAISTVVRTSSGDLVSWSTPGGAGGAPALSGVVDFEVEDFHGIALLADGSIVGWGDNQFGEASSIPPRGPIRDVATGADHMLIIREPGTVSALGLNLFGQASVPANLPLDLEFAAAGWTHSAAAGPSGLFQWGLYPPLEVPQGRIEHLSAFRFTTIVIVDQDQDDDGILDVDDNCDAEPNPEQGDCNGDGIGDACEISDPSLDCDANGVPDACQIQKNPSLDTNQDGVLDACVPVPCYGDLNGDGVVSGADLAILLAFWGPSGLFPSADIDESGNVDGADLAVLLAGWGDCS